MIRSSDFPRTVHDPTSHIWKFRLTRRLERAGGSTLLEIDLRAPPPDRFNLHKLNSFNVQGDFTFDTARQTAKELLVMLAGPYGELCHRWKSLRLCIDNVSLGEEMAYPSPNLEFAWLE
jgi:hypothetical protein